MKKIDIHIHSALEDFPCPETALRRPEAIMAYLRNQGVEIGIQMSMGETGPDSNESVGEISSQNPGIYWTCNFDNRDPDTVFDRMAAYKEMGAVGVGELAINQRIDSPMIESIFAAAEKMEMPVLFHMSPREGFQYGIVDDPGLPLLEEALKKHPHLILIGHSQTFWIEISGDAPKDCEGRYGRGEGPVTLGGRLPELLRKYPNLYGDLSAGSGCSAIMRDEGFGLRFLEEFQNQLMFGTDTVTSKPEWPLPLWKWLEERYAEGLISETVMRKICYENAERIYGISLHQESNTVIFSTKCGKVKGLREEGYCVFKGIPYARAERFQYPTEVTQWEDILNGTAYGPCCYQIRSFLSEAVNPNPFYYREFREGTYFHYADDCQNLNIWAPEKKQNCPVLIYIHGGAFIGGSGGEKHFDASKLVKKGILVVTLNYRLGPFGFMCSTDGLEEVGHTGNYGLYDQLTALRWVNHNIQEFGGNPENVTLMGQSAGGMCVQLLCSSELTEGLFHRAIILSGTGFGEHIFEEALTQEESAGFGERIIKAGGCASLKEFKRLGNWKILEAFMKILGETKGNLGIASPVVDGMLVKQSAHEGILGGKMRCIPYIVTATSEDLWQPGLTEAVLALGKKCFEQGNNWFYGGFFSRQLPGDGAGAFHSSDLWYWFGSLDNCWRPFTEWDYSLSDAMGNMLVSFAETGNPNPAPESVEKAQAELPVWKSINTDTNTLMNFGDTRICYTQL